MTDYEKVKLSYVSNNLDYMEIEGEFFDTICVPLMKTQNGKAELQMIYEFMKDGTLISVNSREVA